jgi:predicted transposase YdaD
MLGITLKETRVYKEIKEEGREEREAEILQVLVPLLLRMGMSVEQIAQEVNIDVEAIRRAANQE